MTSPAEFGSVVRNYRARTGLNQEEAARLMGLAAATLNRLEMGHTRNVRRETAEAVARVLRIPDFVMGEQGFPGLGTPTDRPSAEVYRSNGAPPLPAPTVERAPMPEPLPYEREPEPEPEHVRAPAPAQPPAELAAAVEEFRAFGEELLLQRASRSALEDGTSHLPATAFLRELDTRRRLFSSLMDDVAKALSW